jgi:hypothetical protein
LIISNKERKLLFVSEIHVGTVPDIKILEKEFPPKTSWFAGKIVRIDLGFQSFIDKYIAKETHIPHKRKRVPKGQSNELTDIQKEENKELGKERIYVEHSIGGFKRFKILVNRLRIKSRYLINQIIGVCAALWNLSLSLKG